MHLPPAPCVRRHNDQAVGACKRCNLRAILFGKRGDARRRALHIDDAAHIVIARSVRRYGVQQVTAVVDVTGSCASEQGGNQRHKKHARADHRRDRIAGQTNDALRAM